MLGPSGSYLLSRLFDRAFECNGELITARGSSHKPSWGICMVKFDRCGK